MNNATKVSFDSFLRLFLSRCLVGEEKTRYETLQKRIEELQVKRYNNVASKRSQQDSLEDDPANQMLRTINQKHLLKKKQSWRKSETIL